MEAHNLNSIERTLRRLTVATLATWGICLLYAGMVFVHLSRLDAPTHEVIPAFVWSLVGSAASYWVGFRSSERLPMQAAAIIQFVLLVIGAAFLVAVATPRAWWAS